VTQQHPDPDNAPAPSIGPGHCHVPVLLVLTPIGVGWCDVPHLRCGGHTTPLTGEITPSHQWSHHWAGANPKHLQIGGYLMVWGAPQCHTIGHTIGLVVGCRQGGHTIGHTIGLVHPSSCHQHDGALAIAPLAPPGVVFLGAHRATPTCPVRYPSPRPNNKQTCHTSALPLRGAPCRPGVAPGPGPSAGDALPRQPRGRLSCGPCRGNP
jgi:hypothetical protein